MFTFTVTYNGIVREIVPYNYDTVEIAFEKYSDFGAFMMLPKISKIELISEDYLYLKPLMDANKCDLFILTATCGAINYLFSFNFYSTDFDLDNCKMSINSNRYMPNFDLFLDSLEDATTLRGTVANNQIQANLSLYTNYIYTQAKELNETITYLTSLTGTSWSSYILLQKHNPLVLDDSLFDGNFAGITTTNNPFNRLFLVKSLSGDHSINAPFDMSLSEILQNLNSKLNLFWSFDEVNNMLTIEHLIYFENSRQLLNLYTNHVEYATTPISQLDLTVLSNGIYLDDTNNTTINIAEFCSYESRVNRTKHSTYSSYISFDIRTFYQCSLFKKVSEVKSDWDTNIIMIEDNLIDTMLLIGCDNQTPDTNGYFAYRWQISNYYLLNHFFASGVLFAWFQWGKKMAKYKRILAEPELIAKSTIKNRKQSDVVFPLCCEVLDETKTIKTDLGEGYIDEYTLNTNGFVNATLKYEDND